ncbi:MAG: O-antigen ligase family protein [bacterium]
MANELTLNRINFFLKWFIISLLILIGLAIGVGLLYSEKWTLIIFTIVFTIVAIIAEPYLGAMFYLLCLYARPMEIIPATKDMPVMKFLAIGTLGIWLLRMLIIRDRKFVKAPQNYLMIAFILVMAASMRTYVTGIVDVLTGDFFKIIVIYFLLINLVNTERRLYATIWILILSTLWLAIHSILLSRGIVIGDVSLVEGSRVKSSGIFSDPNDLAQAIVVAIPFIFNLFFYERLVMKKIILGAIGVVMLFAFLLTGSRGGFIGLAVVMFLLIRRKTGTIAGAFLSIVCLAGLLAFAPDYMIERLESASPYEGTGAGRIEIWYEGWEMFLSNPILGVGMNNYAEYQSTHHVAHNSFVHVAAELGLPGLIIWMGLLYFSFKALNETRKVYAPEAEISKAHVLSDSLIASMIGFLSTAFFLSRQYSYLPYILIGLSVVGYQIANKDMGLMLRFSLPELRNVLLATLAFLVIWVGILKVFL